MDITRRSDYACRILRAAYYSGEKPVSVADIAEQESIPYAFARSIQHDLVKSGLVRALRGAYGGLLLNCDPKETSLLAVLEAVQGPVTVAGCVDDPDFCDKHESCAYNRVWCGVDKLVQDYLSSITLDTLLTMGGEHPVIKEALDEAAPAEVPEVLAG